MTALTDIFWMIRYAPWIARTIWRYRMGRLYIFRDAPLAYVASIAILPPIPSMPGFSEQAGAELELRILVLERDCKQALEAALRQHTHV